MFLKKLLLLLRFRRDEAPAVAAPEVEFYPAFAFQWAEFSVAGAVDGELDSAGALGAEVWSIGVLEGELVSAGPVAAEFYVAGAVDGEVVA